MKAIKMWWIRHFLVLTKEQAKKLGLTPWFTIYGDNRSLWGCKCIWIDKQGRLYRVIKL
jgi:hypothetical protein